MSFSTKWYYLKETFTSLKRNSLMSIASVTTVALSILVLGLFLTMVLNVNNLAQYLENQVQVTVYMSDAATSVQRRQVEQQLKTTRGVMEVKGVTKEEALQNFKKRLREQEKLLDALGEDNPFPYSFEVQVDKPERIQEIVPQIEKMPGVETAKFGQEVVEHLFPALQLPGGVYNFGSGNDADMVTTARQFAEALGVQVQIEPADFSRNLVMDSSKLAAQGIRFNDTLSSFEGCLRFYQK